ncbi:MAG TPA: hypothetical protein VK388_10155 [Pyrinomonadaceae bacterium]|nr:hypothetical protein [Pyrinomonadaceae bacterium]
MNWPVQPEGGRPPKTMNGTDENISADPHAPQPASRTRRVSVAPGELLNLYAWFGVLG